MFETLESRQLLAGQQLLVDINTQDSSNPRDFVEFGDQMFFVADHKDYGTELFVTDGTSEGTHLLKDISPGTFSSRPAKFVVSGDYLFFVAASIGSARLWRTDGTEAGTIEVDERAAGYGNSFANIDEMVDVNGQLFFTDSVASGGGIFTTRGDANGIDTVAWFGWSDLEDAQQLTGLNGKLYFIGTDEDSGNELWVAGEEYRSAKMVVDLVPGSGGIGAELVSSGDSLYFFATTDTLGFWKSDGTATGTTRVETFADEAARSLVGADDTLYFVTGTTQTKSKLWRTDGTELGTELAYEPASPANLNNLSQHGDRVYFEIGRQLYAYHADSGADVVYSLPLYGSFSAGARASFDDEYYFVVKTTWGSSALWKTDGTADGTYQVLENAGDTVRVALGQLFVTANPNLEGFELWKLQSSASSAELVVDLPAPKTDDSDPRDLLMVGEKLYFTANPGGGRALWVNNGTVGNATRLIDVVGIQQTVLVGERLYFVGVDYTGQAFLGVTDGTQENTHRFEIDFASQFPAFSSLTAFEGELLFTVTDSAGGITLSRASGDAVEVISPLGGDPRFAGGSSAVVDERMYFSAPGTIYGALWETDGTAAGTRIFLDQPASELIVHDGWIYFVSGNRSRLWRTDGTAENTTELPNVRNVSELTRSGGYLYFKGKADTNSQVELWRINTGDTAATLVVPSTWSWDISLFDKTWMVDVDGTLYFLSSGISTRGLYKTTGPGTTSRVASIPQGSSRELIAIDGLLYLGSGYELYRSDGTHPGTFRFGVPVSLVKLPLSDNLAGYAGRLYYSSFESEIYFISSRTEVTGQQLFYSGSRFDTNGAALGPEDDAAIASDKSAYFAGSGPATFENVSSYVHGITGVMVDFNFLTAEVTVDDFQFRMGSTNNLETWTEAPAPAAFLAKTGFSGNVGNPVRVSFAWPNGAIRNTWLEVTVLANERTGLETPTVFYFGNRVGETSNGDPSQVFTTSAQDEIKARSNPGFRLGVTSLYDFNRDGMVSAADQIIARNNGGFLTRLNLPGTFAPLSTAPIALAASDVEVTSSLATESNLPTRLVLERTAADRGLAFALAHEWQRRADEADDSLLDEPLLELITAGRRQRR